MEKQRFNSLINKDYKFANKEYATGVIMGIAVGVCDIRGEDREEVWEDGTPRTVHVWHGGYWHNEEEDYDYLTVLCTAEQYEKFIEYVDKVYPGSLTYYWEKDRMLS